MGFAADLEPRLAAAHPGAAIASVGGRYFAMDRDRRWDRTERGYDAIVHGEAAYHARSATEAIEAAYARGETDEFVTPTVIDGFSRALADGDGDPIIHANFRADRARQLTHALVDGPAFSAFDRRSPTGRLAPTDLLVVTMTEYEEGLGVRVAFPPEIVRSLADAVAEAGWRQFHVAETEKYAHVTYFFNGGLEAAHPGEDRRLIPSPRVATYDLAPEMSAAGVTDALVEAIGSGTYDVIVANYANPDMVGHTGAWDATLQALATIDACLARIVAAIEGVDADDPTAPGGLLAITADHGNADQLRDAYGQPQTAHSLNPVPFVLVGRAAVGLGLRDGVLADVAPTLLEFAGLPRWPGMTGRSLVL
jgi:2,3-bisphosphoglycerate-independent phosphoglycerate mutase